MLSGYPTDGQSAGSQWMTQGKPKQVGPSNGPGEYLLFYTLSTFGDQSGAKRLVPDMTSRGICGVHVTGDSDPKTSFALRINDEHLQTIRERLQGNQAGYALDV